MIEIWDSTDAWSARFRRIKLLYMQLTYITQNLCASVNVTELRVAFDPFLLSTLFSFLQSGTEMETNCLTRARKSLWRLSHQLRETVSILQLNGQPRVQLNPNSITPTLRQSARPSSWTFSSTFPMNCHQVTFIRATQTDLSQTCHGLCRNHLDMVCVGEESFGESQRNGIRAL